MISSSVFTAQEESAEWPQTPVLQPTFLHAIPLKDPYRRALTRWSGELGGISRKKVRRCCDRVGSCRCRRWFSSTLGFASIG
jgi:hypothetical protein